MGFETVCEPVAHIERKIIKQSLWDLKRVFANRTVSVFAIIKQSLWDLKLS